MGKRWRGSCCRTSFSCCTDTPITQIGPSIDLLSSWKTEGKALWKCPWRSEGLWVLCKQHKIRNEASKTASLSTSSSVTSFPLWRKGKARGRGQREGTLSIFFVLQKLGCWTCCKFSYVQKGAPNVFGLFLPSTSSPQSYYIGFHWDSSDRCWTPGEWAAKAVMLLSLSRMRMSKKRGSLLTLHCSHLSAQSRAISQAESRQGAAAAEHFPEAMDWDGAAAA